MPFDDPEKEALWATVRALNEAWTQGDPAQLTAFFHPRMVAITPTERRPIQGAAACVAGWSGFAQAGVIHHWQEENPIIELHGDAAVVAYDFHIVFERQGELIRSRGREMYFFVRERGRWWAAADQFSAAP